MRVRLLDASDIESAVLIFGALNAAERVGEGVIGSSEIPQAIGGGHIFGACEKSEVRGLVSIGEKMWGKLAHVDWTQIQKPFLIRCLVVHPAFRRRGIARRLAIFAEATARTEGGDAVRVAVSGADSACLRLFRGMEYKERGEIGTGPTRLICLEKQISTLPA